MDFLFSKNKKKKKGDIGEYSVNTKGLYLLDYLIRKYINEEEDYIAAYEESVENLSETTGETKARVALGIVVILLNGLPQKDRKQYIERINDEELKDSLRKDML